MTTGTAIHFEAGLHYRLELNSVLCVVELQEQYAYIVKYYCLLDRAHRK